MNKYFNRFLLLFSLLIVKNVISQNDIEIRISSFASGDIASVSDILKYPSLTIINRNAINNAKLISYECVFSNMDKKRNPKGVTSLKNESFALSPESIALLSKFLPGDDFSIKDITVEVVNIKTGALETVKLEPITLKIAASSGGAVPKGTVDYVGKLITGKDHNQPVANQKVVLQDNQETEIQSTTTDNYGDFKFKELSADKSYKINVLVTDDTKIKDGQLYAAKPDGTIIRTFNKTKKGFVYELLPEELNTLAKEKEEDTELAIKNFGASKESELTVIEDIYYDFNSADIKDESVPKLDKIIAAMAGNKALKLSINSHTDSKGDDAYNMALSEKRAQKVMEYFILQGIEKERLKAKGFGETQIKNRCKNDVDCSELEHQLNRRTEFKFTK
jgi:outer membrane protein OmpA-like peptidoglycan-associated protein